MRRGDLFVLSWESLRRVEWDKVSSFLSMSGGTSKSVPASTRLEDPSRKGTTRTAKSAPFNPCPSREGPYSTVFSVSRPMDPLMWLAGLLALSGDVEMAPDVSTATGWKMKRRPNSAYLAIFLTSAASDPAASAARIRFKDANMLTHVAST